MHLLVKPEDIKNGVQESHDSCPLALCLKRYGFKDVQVGNLCFRHKGGVCEFPRVVADKILDYDLFGRMTPFAFEIEATP